MPEHSAVWLSLTVKWHCAENLILRLRSPMLVTPRNRRLSSTPISSPFPHAQDLFLHCRGNGVRRRRVFNGPYFSASMVEPIVNTPSFLQLWAASGKPGTTCKKLSRSIRFHTDKR